ncbi:MAG: MFS transporter [Gammaproteobacteria bacterium]|uniref:MFS transporter n=1 Tax=Rhodoferax sp. TaxID=50421 RepID=UPI0017F3DD13|nr:MFS transporter [Rhodoferax sp.]MBU3900327.1 MFS transporter [Gammaproteobacteria bacterium]MBA3058485.1 MFS transporter [Rhodoferax sp.]MBU3998034.1 MFS transporter [Gammaproteobacteria bacterium]MBU4018914.1 MFS transporter [Gammaproteobacteria bacterium]MBU4080904.1 MFS transporter [Gammaproteobacteria bacterium]
MSSVGQSFFIGLFGASIQQELFLRESQWGALYGVATGISGVLMFWLGALADRLTIRRAITLALGVLGLGTLLMALASGPLMLLLGLFCLRLGGQGLTGHMAIVTATRYARHRGRSIATATFGFILGEALLPLGVTAMLGLTSWRWVWAGAAVLVLLVALPALRMTARRLPRVPAHLDAQGAPVARLLRRQLLRRPTFYAVLSVVLVSPFVVTAVFLHLGALSTLRNWSAVQVAQGFIGFALAQAGTTWLTGRWVGQRSIVMVFRLYLLPLAVGLLLAALAPSQMTLWGLFLGLGITAGANSVVSGSLWAEIFGVENLGMVRGVHTGLMVIATAVSPIAFGLALEATTPLSALAGGIALYAVLVPVLAARWLFTPQLPLED